MNLRKLFASSKEQFAGLVCTSVVFGVLFSSTSMAQSPTAAFLRIQNRRWAAADSTPDQSSPAPALARVVRSSAFIHDGVVRARVVVQAPTMTLARAEAERQVNHMALRKTVRTARDMNPLRDRLIAAVTELRLATAKIRTIHETSATHSSTIEVEGTNTIPALMQAFRATLPNSRLIVLLPETVDGGTPSATPKVETALADALVRNRFEVIDGAYLAKQQQAGAVARISDRSADAELRDTETALACNILIVGHTDAMYSQENSGIVSYNATTVLRVLQAETGQVLLATELRDKGFGQDREQAAREALEALATQIVARVPEMLRSRLSQQPVMIEVSGAGTPGHAAEAEAYLKTVRGVLTVEPITTTPASATFRVIGCDNPAALAAQVLKNPDYTVTAVADMRH